MRFIAAILAALLVAGAASAADLKDVVKIRAGVNGAWFNGATSEFPNDFEAGSAVSASLSPHISLVGAGWYGFDHDYLRWLFGPRITVTDVDNPNFSVGLGADYNGSSAAALEPNEWALSANVGWVPLPQKMPKVSLIGQGSYGLKTNNSRVILGARYLINLP